MNHPGDLLSAFLDGELDAAGRGAVAEHLAGCAPCRAEADDVAAARTAVRGLPMLQPPPGLLPGPRADRDRARRRRWVPMWAASAAAAAAVVVGLVVLGGRQPAPAADLETFADRHTARLVVDPGISTVRGPGGSP